MIGFSGDLPLHQLQPLSRFSDRAEDYARFRPTYTTAAIVAMLDGLGDPTKTNRRPSN
ncbi:hypothetical protein [Leptodesmis sichuanensis]|uniref:hypothetical protein n=1 Tax=Leptodesmis sichuanensis TaxID=2906798 RepID=UPI001F17E2B6|nr:hypothetical protein [Leptodesmis sichuanensis]UIE37452.1 hypothetical protein KIK02_21330 [Leptodesmis sichuanensis A121]